MTNHNQDNYEIAAPISSIRQKENTKKPKTTTTPPNDFWWQGYFNFLMVLFIGSSFVSSAFYNKQTLEAFKDGSWVVFLFICFSFVFVYAIENSRS